MTERGILFKGEMVRAILDGRKTQTRRVMQMRIGGGTITPGTVDGFTLEPRYGSWVPWVGVEDTDAGVMAGLDEWICPYGMTGDRLWVRETWQTAPSGAICPVNYRADYGENIARQSKWRPSIFMPRWASRITLEVTGVRVERVQDISEADAIAEGLWQTDGIVQRYYSRDKSKGGVYRHAKNAYHELWDSINGDTFPWASNPWVWVIEFRRVK